MRGRSLRPSSAETVRQRPPEDPGVRLQLKKNIIGDRVLGLPRDISVDVQVPFKDLKVGTQKAND